MHRMISGEGNEPLFSLTNGMGNFRFGGRAKLKKMTNKRETLLSLLLGID
jgi:hypothetical protein